MSEPSVTEVLESMIDKHGLLHVLTGTAPNAIVIWNENGRGPNGMYEGRAALLETANSPLAGTSVSDGYLRECCKRVSREVAFAAHPALKAEYESSKGYTK